MFYTYKLIKLLWSYLDKYNLLLYGMEIRFKKTKNKWWLGKENNEKIMFYIKKNPFNVVLIHVHLSIILVNDKINILYTQHVLKVSCLPCDII